MKKLLTPYNGKSLQLKNHIVMAPMTRSRAIGNLPNTLMARSPETAESQLQNGDADLIAFGRSFLANPDFVERIIAGASLNPVDYSTLYTPGLKGYIDYATMTSASEQTVL
jgi:2,4-dienoyl-CoA reductase-like NADH-dependent reductase (Old Yellow Enzyme family)